MPAPATFSGTTVSTADTGRVVRRKYFLGGLKKGTTPEEVRASFEAAAAEGVSAVTQVHIPYAKDGHRKQFAFVTVEYSNPDAVLPYGKHTVGEHEVSMKPMLKEGQNDDPTHALNTKKLFVRGIPDNTTEAHLRSAFSKYGPIESVSVIRDKAGAPRGFGFVEFQRRNSVRAASVAHNVVNGVQVQCAPKVANKSEKMRNEIKRSVRALESASTSPATSEEVVGDKEPTQEVEVEVDADAVVAADSEAVLSRRKKPPAEVATSSSTTTSQGKPELRQAYYARRKKQRITEAQQRRHELRQAAMKRKREQMMAGL